MVTSKKVNVFSPKCILSVVFVDQLFVHTIFLETLSKNKSCQRCLLAVWVPILAAEGPHWVPISLVTINFGHSACRKLRQDTVG